jgi:hypothetical protein
VSKTLIVEYEKYCESNQVTGIGSINRQEIISKYLLDSF